MAVEEATTQTRPIEALLEFERTKKILEYLLANLQEIMGCEALKITFDCRGKAVKVSKTDSRDL